MQSGCQKACQLIIFWHMCTPAILYWAYSYTGPSNVECFGQIFWHIIRLYARWRKPWFRDDLPSQSLDWCKNCFRPNQTATKLQHIIPKQQLLKLYVHNTAGNNQFELMRQANRFNKRIASNSRRVRFVGLFAKPVPAVVGNKTGTYRVALYYIKLLINTLIHIFT